MNIISQTTDPQDLLPDSDDLIVSSENDKNAWYMVKQSKRDAWIIPRMEQVALKIIKCVAYGEQLK